MSMIQLSEADQGKSVTVKKGDQLVIRLTANPTTGFNWELQPNPHFQVSHRYEGGDTGKGGGGQDVFTLAPQAGGQTGMLAFVYKRAWTQSAEEKQFSIQYQLEG